jgi:hypothetical protein
VFLVGNQSKESHTALIKSLHTILPLFFIIIINIKRSREEIRCTIAQSKESRTEPIKSSSKVLKKLKVSPSLIYTFEPEPYSSMFDNNGLRLC